MNTPKRTMLTTALALLLVSQSASFAADTDPTQGAQRAVIGVRLDPHRLPRLLTKHLQLEQGQGLVILNVLKDSPADHAGLDRDDIILTLQGELVTDYRAAGHRLPRLCQPDPASRRRRRSQPRHHA